MWRLLGRFVMILGAALLFGGGLFALGATQALLERLHYGRGLMFADVEILSGGAVLLLGLGAGAMRLGRRLKEL